MKRSIITMSESGNIIMPDNVTDIWMSEQELGDLFGVIAPTFRASIRAIYKSGALKEYQIGKRLSCKCIQSHDDSCACFPYQ